MGRWGDGEPGEGEIRRHGDGEMNDPTIGDCKIEGQDYPMKRGSGQRVPYAVLKFRIRRVRIFAFGTGGRLG